MTYGSKRYRRCCLSWKYSEYTLLETSHIVKKNETIVVTIGKFNETLVTIIKSYTP